MGISKVLSTLILGSILLTPTTQAIELKGPDGKYRHDDHEVRAELLSIARTLNANNMKDKSLKLYKQLIRKWKKPHQNKERKQACSDLFYLLVDQQKAEQWREHMSGCPTEEVGDIILNFGNRLAVRQAHEAAASQYIYLARNADSFSGNSHKDKACTQLGTLLSRLPAEKLDRKTLSICSEESLRKGELKYAIALIPKNGLARLHLYPSEQYGVYDEKLDLETPLTKSLETFKTLIDKWQQPEQIAERNAACSMQVQILKWANRFEKNSPWLEDCSESSIRKGLCNFGVEFNNWHLAKGRRAKNSERHLASDLFEELLTQWQFDEAEDEKKIACINLAQIYDYKNRNTDLSEFCTPSQLRWGKLLRADFHDYINSYDNARRYYRRAIKEWTLPDQANDRLIACQLFKWHLSSRNENSVMDSELRECDNNRLVDTPYAPNLDPVVQDYISASHFRGLMVAEHQFYSSEWEGQLKLLRCRIPRMNGTGTLVNDGVQMEFDLSKYGRPQKIRFLSRSQTKNLDKIASRSLKRWRFEPKIVDGKPAKVKNLRQWIYFRDTQILEFEEYL